MNVTIFAELLKESPLVCGNAVLPEPLARNRSAKNLIFKESTRKLYSDKLCLFRALAFHSHGNDKLEGDAPKFQSIYMNDIPFVQSSSKTNIFLYEIDIMKGVLDGKLASRSI